MNSQSQDPTQTASEAQAELRLQLCSTESSVVFCAPRVITRQIRSAFPKLTANLRRYLKSDDYRPAGQGQKPKRPPHKDPFMNEFESSHDGL